MSIVIIEVIIIHHILQVTQTPLFVASLNGKLSTVKTLVDRGARIDQPNDVRLFMCIYPMSRNYGAISH